MEPQVMSNALEHYHNFLLVIERWTLVVAGNEKAYILLFNAFQQGHNDLATVFTIAAAGGLFQDDVCFSFFFGKEGFMLARAWFLYKSRISRIDSRYETLKT